jgi:hypothetical protein
MSRQFTCDDCGRVFAQPLDEIEYKDDHGVNHILDMCAPCRKKLKDKQEKTSKDVLSKLVKEVKSLS